MLEKNMLLTNINLEFQRVETLLEKKTLRIIGISFFFFFCPKQFVGSDYFSESLKQALLFYLSAYKSFENAVRKVEIARHEQFLLFSKCFLLIWRTRYSFHKM